ncbi:zinc-binding dehydrogenase [Flaviflexus equikiangi]|uniref:zinc-binding dehydrogenase n=1 Tax=Flaviflexus equikiangi TaxID=2758573 RepID=UPI0015F741BF|nr:alcohol dehydrogenase catalytic domain-containing protein [Flaviflexus equikiangi]
MRAAVLVGPGRLEMQDVPTPTAGPGELVLKVGANTVCGTDGRILRGEKTAGVRPGVIMGHEFSGYVHEVGAGVVGYREGDLVGVMPTVPCLRCHYCLNHLEHVCVDAKLFGYWIDGGLAEYVHVSAEAIERGAIVVADPDANPAEIALAEPLGCVLNGVDNYGVTIGDSVLIIGAGPIGLLHTMVAKQMGASQIIVVNRSAERLETARQAGATHTALTGDIDVPTYVKDMTGGLGVDVAVQCIGALDLFQTALMSVRNGGRVNAFAGFPKGEMASIDPNLIHYNELTVTGGSNMGRNNYRRAVQLIGDGTINVGALLTDTFALEDTAAAIEHASAGKGIKTAVVPS